MKNHQAYSYMKNIKSFAILILFTLGACSPASGTVTPPAPTPAPTPEVTSPDLVYLTNVLNSKDGFYKFEDLSPNGKWLFQPGVAINGKHTLQLTSTIDPTQVIKTPMSEDMGYRLDTYDDSWSPDSSMIVLIGRNKKDSRTSHRVVIFHLEGEKPMTHAVFEFPDPELYAINSFAWSPDSTRLALNSYDGTVYIIDRQARLLATFQQLGEWHKGGLLWTEEGIFYTTWDSDPFPRQPTELYLVDPDHPEQQKRIYKQDDYFYSVSYNMEEHQLLLKEGIYNGVDIFPKSRLLILNLNDEKIEQAIDLPGVQGTSGYINFDQPTFYREFSEENQHTYVFDWPTKNWWIMENITR